MNTAHIFYIPILLMVGFFMGFFSGRRAAESEQAEAQRKRARRARAASSRDAEAPD